MQDEHSFDDMSPPLPGKGPKNQSKTPTNLGELMWDNQISMLEQTAIKLYPIIQEVVKHMVDEETEPALVDARLRLDKQPLQTSLTNRSGAESPVPDASRPAPNPNNNTEIDMRTLLGYLNQNEWLYLLNIGNIMQISPLTVQDLYATSTVEVELSRDSILEKISFLSVSYFCVSTELRFMMQLMKTEDERPQA